MEWIASLCLGITLAAATGLRVFVPMLVLSAAAQVEGSPVHLGEGWAWLASPWVTAGLAVATLLEIGAYYIPWVDNLLDTVATPTAVIAGALVSAAATSEFHPALQWATALAGGGAAATVQLGTVLLRAVSSTTTGGLGNPVVSTGEAAGSTGLSFLAIVVPFLAGILVACLTVWIVIRILRWRRERATTAGGLVRTSSPGA
jgi:hypothetical protein